MADDPECFGNYNKINSGERAENDCLHCPVLDECARVLNPLKDAFRAGRNVCDAGVKCDASRIQVGESAIAEIDRLRAENERLKMLCHSYYQAHTHNDAEVNDCTELWMQGAAVDGELR